MSPSAPVAGEGFSSRRAVASNVKLVYCPTCGAVTTNVIGEHDICTACGAPAEPMDSGRPWQYWVSSAILLGAAAVFVWGPFTDLLTRGVILFSVVVVSYALSSWGMKQSRKRILDEVARRKAAEGKA